MACPTEMANHDVNMAELSAPATDTAAAVTSTPERETEPPTTCLPKGKKHGELKRNKQAGGNGEWKHNQKHGLIDDSSRVSITGSPTGHKTTALNSSPQPHPSNQFCSPARSTRSRKPVLHNKFEWGALTIEQKKFSPQNNMSRNRPRGAPTSRDNGAAANEEIEMWNRISQDLQKAKEKNEKQRLLGQQIAALNEKIAKDGNKPTLSEIDQLDSYHRQLLKLSEEEKAILKEEPHDIIRNLQILTALRSASEADPQGRAKPRKRKTEAESSATDSPGPATASVSDKLNRVKSAQRSSSISSTQAREGTSVKSEEGTEGIKSSMAEKGGHFFVGAEVVFKNKKQQGLDGEGIQCTIKSISGDGNKRRYEVEDAEPTEKGIGAIYRTTATSLTAIPKMGSSLPSFHAGKQVMARYPDTTTFYRAEVLGAKKDVYRLRFEGEEDDKEQEVDRRFVLDIPGK